MAVDIRSLEPQIRAILLAPGTDLSTISAKRVRKQLLEQNASLTADFVKERKDEIDALIANVYEEVSAQDGAQDADDAGHAHASEDAHSERSSVKRKTEADDDEVAEADADDDAATPPPKKAKKARKTKTELTDAEIARQLSNELNGRGTRSSRSDRAGGGARPKKGGRKNLKSAAVVNSDGEDEDEGSESERPKKRRGGFAKEYILSAPLANLLNQERLSRPQVVKGLWDHIKGKDLQNPDNRREILCDDSMRAIFNVDKIDMFRMNKVLGQHLHEP